MNFFTPVKIPDYPISLNHQNPVMLLGSCFAENIGLKLKENKFQSLTNPFGIIYNPISLAKSLKRIFSNEHYSENELEQHNQLWLSWDHHGCFSTTSKENTLQQINESIEEANLLLGKTKTIVLTFGSAWVYEHKATSHIVANCHKLPATTFSKRLLNVEEVVRAMNEIVECLPNVQFIFTVSPVRHIKDGLHENNLSKSVLHLAIKEIIEYHKNCFYFPSYELVVDELRDYRFFNEDMFHPNPQAIDFVWKKFSEAFFNKDTQDLLLKIEKVKNAAQHKPFNFESEQHQQFIQKQLIEISKLQQDYLELNFDEEQEMLKQTKTPQ